MFIIKYNRIKMKENQLNCNIIIERSSNNYKNKNKKDSTKEETRIIK